MHFLCDEMGRKKLSPEARARSRARQRERKTELQRLRRRHEREGCARNAEEQGFQDEARLFCGTLDDPGAGAEADLIQDNSEVQSPLNLLPAN